MDWQTLFTAFAGALGGTATALLIAGTLGKGLIDQWLKKDFKRFETKLDAFASRDQTKFDYLHPEKAKAALDIFAMCVALRAKLAEFPEIDEDSVRNPTAYKQKVFTTVESVIKQLVALTQYVSPRSVYFEGELQNKLNRFPRHVLKELAEKLRFNTEATVNEVSEQIVGIEQDIKKLLGVIESPE